MRAAPRVTRSKACDTCRARKIKCDERYPICSQCQTSDRACSGATVGNVFVNVGNRITRRHPNARDKGEAQVAEEVVRDEVKADHSKQEVTSLLTSHINTAVLAAGFRLPSWYQPSKSAAFQQFFMSHFLKSYAAVGAKRPEDRFWMLSMLELPSYAENTLRPAILAVSMAFYGKLASDKDIENQGHKWYAVSLASQRKRLAQDSKETSLIPSPEAICIPLLMSAYESVTPTMQHGWLLHLLGAARMIQMRGPEQCQTSLAFQTFRSVRLALVYVAVAREQPSFFASEMWLNVPFLKTAKIPIDRLVDTLSVIPIYLEKLKHLRSNESQPTPSSVSAIRGELLNLDAELEEIWRRFFDGNSAQNEPPFIRSFINTTSSDNQEHASLLQDFSSKPWMIEAKSFYDSAKLLIISSISSVSLPGAALNYKNQIISHCESILSVIKYTNLLQSQTGKIVSAPYRMLFPLKIVYHKTVDDTQREFAGKRLAEWVESYGLAQPT